MVPEDGFRAIRVIRAYKKYQRQIKKTMIYPQNFEQKIGFDSIRHLLKERCLSTLGEERVTDMAFSESYDEINRRLEEVTEFIRIIQEEDEFPDQYFFDVRPSLKRIRVEGMYLEEQELFDLRRSLETIRDIVRFLQRSSEEDEEESASPYPYLHELAGDIIVFPQLISRINNILDKFGKIKAVNVILLFVSLIVYFGSKIAFSKIQSIVFWQILNQLSILLVLYFMFAVFIGLEDYFKKIPNRINKAVKFVAGITLHIYIVQFIIIRRLEGLVFPVNFLVTTVAILLLACMMYYAEFFIKKGILLLVGKIKGKKENAESNN